MYHLIDTASVYKNEGYIASSLKSISRQDIFITSKLGPKDHGSEKAQLAFEKTLHNLQTDYLDLYLIHWPGVQGLKVRIPVWNARWTCEKAIQFSNLAYCNFASCNFALSYTMVKLQWAK